MVKSICLTKEISGLNGFKLIELFNGLTKDLYINKVNIEPKAKDINIVNDINNCEN